MQNEVPEKRPSLSQQDWLPTESKPPAFGIMALLNCYLLACLSDLLHSWLVRSLKSEPSLVSSLIMSWLGPEHGCELQVPDAPPKLSDVPSVPDLAKQLLGNRFAVGPMGTALSPPDSRKKSPWDLFE